MSSAVSPVGGIAGGGDVVNILQPATGVELKERQVKSKHTAWSSTGRGMKGPESLWMRGTALNGLRGE